MEKSKNYRVLVEQVDRFNYEFSIASKSKTEAKGFAEKMIEEEPLDRMKNIYERTEVNVEIVTDPPRVHTVEALFDIDRDINDEEVILVADLSEEQKCFLGLKAKDIADECTDYCFVCSSGGSLRVNLQDGFVIQCSTIQDDDNELKQIVRFDVEEYKAYYKVINIPGHLDILDLGYWNSDGSYEKPVEDWRNEMRRSIRPLQIPNSYALADR